MNGRGWIVGGWLISLAASLLPVLWVLSQKIERNPLGKYVDVATGQWTWEVYRTFLLWWLPIAVPITLLALACMFLNRRGRGGGNGAD